MATEFKGDNQATLYAKYRPKVDPRVIDMVLDFLKEKIPLPLTSAVDAACGSGQSTEILAEHFNTVIGIDISTAQINEARKATQATNVQYCVTDAEHIPAEDGSVNLVTCSQAAHWLDFQAFCNEVDRVLMASGCLAVFARGHQKLQHENKKVAEKLNELCSNFLRCTLKQYWEIPFENQEEIYRKLQIPYPEFKRHVLQEYRDEPLSNFIGYLKTLTAYQKRYKEHRNDDVLIALQDKILETLQVDTSPEDTIIKTAWPIYLLLGRKP